MPRQLNADTACYLFNIIYLLSEQILAFFDGLYGEYCSLLKHLQGWDILSTNMN